MLKVDKINQILNDFLAPFECECELGTDFEYITTDSLIRYALVVPGGSSEAFLHHVEQLFPNIKADIFIWSVLHELGHHETVDDFEDEDWEDYMEKCGRGLSNEAYFELDIEDAATRWAGEYIQSHVEEIAKLWKDLQDAIQELFSSIHIEP